MTGRTMGDVFREMVEPAISIECRILDVTDPEYFADPCPSPSLTQSTAKTILSKSPAHAALYHPRIGGQPYNATPAMNMGKLIDALVLSGGKGVKEIDAKDYRSKYAQTLKAEAIAAGEIPANTSELSRARAVANKLRARFAEFDVDLDKGRTQLAIAWKLEGLWHRAKLDWYDEETGLIIDLKCRSDVSPRACDRQVFEMGYHIQAEAYMEAVAFAISAGLLPAVNKPLRFIDFFAETEAPYLVTPRAIEGDASILGRRDWGRARRIWADCLRSGNWGGYVSSVEPVTVPPWRMNELTDIDAIDTGGAF